MPKWSNDEMSYLGFSSPLRKFVVSSQKCNLKKNIYTKKMLLML